MNKILSKAVSSIYWLIVFSIVFVQCKGKDDSSDSSNLHAAKIIKSVLFIGNSYTYYNDLEMIVAHLASADTVYSLYTEKTAVGSYTLIEHSVRPETILAIKSRKWDLIVLQEMSTLPITNLSEFSDGAKKMDQIIKETRPDFNGLIFYLTWGRKDVASETSMTSRGITTFNQMQDALTSAYLKVGQERSAEVAPVGIAWQKVRSSYDSQINLYDSDGTHPSFAGSYLTACVFYASICDRSPIGNIYKETLSQNVADILQRKAYEAYLEYKGKGYLK
ncbi:MAG: DUF4886 domain-containing protein [Prolixibacteraceae bacterium]